MLEFIHVSLIIHVSAGTLSLLSGLLAMLLRNNTPRHKKAGIVYFWSMTVVFITGFYISIYKQNLFLLCVSLFSYYSVISAYRILKQKQFVKATTTDWLIEGAAFLSFIGLILIAAYIFGFYTEEKMFAIVPLTFGLIGLNAVRQKYKLYSKGPKEKLFWLKMHVGHMIGSYIAAVTAFLVNQQQHIQIPPVILWLAPTVLFLPLILSEIRKIKFIEIKNNSNA